MFVVGHVRPQRHRTSQDLLRIRFVLDVAVEDMGKGAQEARLARDKPQQVGDSDSRQLTVERAVDELFCGWVNETPASLFASTPNLEV